MAAVMCVALAGCASNKDMAQGEVYDPMEGMNRAMFDVNDALDTVVAEPIARGYRAVTPQFARTGVRNFMRNLRTPVNMANQLLQGDIGGAATDLSRAVINTTIGVGGLFDVAGKNGLEYEEEDFGQTLAVWGIDHGPYLIVPLFGPSSFRDGIGTLVDTYADPLRLYLFNTDQEEWYYAKVATNAVSKREALLDVLEDLQKNSIDYYAAVRSAYIQKREAMVNDDDPESAASYDIPDYDDYDE